MKIKAYIRVLSDEATIRRVNGQLNIRDSSIAELKSLRTEGEHWWNWETIHNPIDIDRVDEELRAFLTQYKTIFPVLKGLSPSEADVYLELSTEYQEGEEPSGLYLSSETISLLDEMGAALDNNVVTRTATGRLR